jgi:hypothetical protein
VLGGDSGSLIGIAALAGGEITPGEAATVAETIDKIVHAIAASKEGELRDGLLQILSGEDDEGIDDDDDRE